MNDKIEFVEPTEAEQCEFWELQSAAYTARWAFQIFKMNRPNKAFLLCDREVVMAAMNPNIKPLFSDDYWSKKEAEDTANREKRNV